MHLFDIPAILSSYGMIGVFIIVFLESGIFFALPGDSLLFTAGLLASALGFNIFLLIPLIFIATFLGGLAGYEIGIRLEYLKRFSVFRKILREEYMQKAHNFFDAHGRFAIIFSRFVPIVRTFMPIAAGAARMRYVSFIKYSFVSSVCWSAIVTCAGYFLGRSFPMIKDYLSYMVVLIVVVSCAPIIMQFFAKKKQSRPME